MKIKNLIRRLKSLSIPPFEDTYILNKSSLLKNACKFVVNERIKGDYYEFGVYQGATLISAYWWLHRMHQIKSKSDKRYNDDIWDNMLFHAFDSFQGLPPLTVEDQYSEDFAEGQYACDIEHVTRKIKSHGVHMAKVIFTKGWFEDTCNPQNLDTTQIRKASIIWLDCDLHSSAEQVFNFIPYLIQDGTIIVIDDWFSNKGSPFHGVQKAFYDWKKVIESEYCIHEYIQDSWKRKSFIVSRKPA